MTEYERKLPDHFLEKYGPDHSHRLRAMYGVPEKDIDREGLLAIIAWAMSDGRKLPLYDSLIGEVES